MPDIKIMDGETIKQINALIRKHISGTNPYGEVGIKVVHKADDGVLNRVTHNDRLWELLGLSPNDLDLEDYQRLRNAVTIRVPEDELHPDGSIYLDIYCSATTDRFMGPELQDNLLVRIKNRRVIEAWLTGYGDDSKIFEDLQKGPDK